jgi:hypothetical protein
LENILSVVSVIWFLPSITTRSGILSTPSRRTVIDGLSLTGAGIVVKTGLLKDEAKELNRGFIKRMETGLPFVTCKIAMRIDGKTFMASGQSKWFTGQEARQDEQKLRAKNQAIPRF